jgi:hypothetical protein
MGMLVESCQGLINNPRHRVREGLLHQPGCESTEEPVKAVLFINFRQTVLNIGVTLFILKFVKLQTCAYDIDRVSEGGGYTPSHHPTHEGRGLMAILLFLISKSTKKKGLRNW